MTHPDQLDHQGEGQCQVLSFTLGEGVFGIDIRCVREIIQFSQLTEVPMMPEFVRGVINLRGAVVPVIDLHARFGKPAAQVSKKTCIVIFHAQREQEKIELGLLVDAVSAVVDIPLGMIEPPPQFGNSIRREFIRGMGKMGEKFIIILEPHKALDVDEMAELARHSVTA
jgi:purine-binding chemotaxis protein CheW